VGPAGCRTCTTTSSTPQPDHITDAGHLQRVTRVGDVFWLGVFWLGVFWLGVFWLLSLAVLVYGGALMLRATA
jgi:hypothetical protein